MKNGVKTMNHHQHTFRFPTIFDSRYLSSLSSSRNYCTTIPKRNQKDDDGTSTSSESSGRKPHSSNRKVFEPTPLSIFFIVVALVGGGVFYWDGIYRSSNIALLIEQIEKTRRLDSRFMKELIENGNSKGEEVKFVGRIQKANSSQSLTLAPKIGKSKSDVNDGSSRVGEILLIHYNFKSFDHRTRSREIDYESLNQDIVVLRNENQLELKFSDPLSMQDSRMKFQFNHNLLINPTWEFKPVQSKKDSLIHLLKTERFLKSYSSIYPYNNVMNEIFEEVRSYAMVNNLELIENKEYPEKFFPTNILMENVVREGDVVFVRGVVQMEKSGNISLQCSMLACQSEEKLLKDLYDRVWFFTRWRLKLDKYLR